ncbi:MAG: hypothetical protein ABI406_03040, partial [Ktedonobacteraceae bacterium]
LLLDYYLPHTTGLTLYDELHALEGLEHIPAILFTGANLKRNLHLNSPSGKKAPCSLITMEKQPTMQVACYWISQPPNTNVRTPPSPGVLPIRNRQEEWPALSQTPCIQSMPIARCASSL